MSQRLQDTTKWLWCLLVLYNGPVTPVRAVTVRTPPKVPATVEAQAKFFQDFFSVQLSPYKIEFGHVCEDPNTWEQRYEKKDFKNHRDMGKVRWGDKQGGYGEHYWDLNHAGHAGNHGDDKYGSDSDDGSYRVHDNEEPYDEPSDHSGNYDNEYDPEKSSFEETNRSKRAHPRIKAEKKEEQEHFEDIPKLKSKYREKKEEEEHFDDIPKLKPKYRKTKDPQTAASRTVEKAEEREKSEKEDSYKPAKPKRQHRPAPREQDYEEDYEQPRELVVRVKEPDTQEQPSQYVSRRQPDHYVPYEGGAGVRQHQPEVTAAASTPRLFLEPSTGHVIDRATGQAYILQPIVANNYN